MNTKFITKTKNSLDGTVQLTVFGKGNQTRFVKLPPKLSSELLAFRANTSSKNCA